MTKKITEAQRLALRGSLVELMGEQQATTLMDSFPPIDYENLATRDDLTLTTHALRTEIGEVRVEMAELRTELRGEMAELRTELRAEIAEVRREMAELKTEVRTEIAQVRVEMAELRTELRGEMAELRTELRVELEKTRGEFRKDMATNTRMMIASNMASMLGFAALVVGFA